MYSDYSLVLELANCIRCELKQAQHKTDIANTFRLISKQIMTSNCTTMPAKHLRLQQRMQKEVALYHHNLTQQQPLKLPGQARLMPQVPISLEGITASQITIQGITIQQTYLAHRLLLLRPIYLANIISCLPRLQAFNRAVNRRTVKGIPDTINRHLCSTPNQAKKAILCTRLHLSLVKNQHSRKRPNREVAVDLPYASRLNRQHQLPSLPVLLMHSDS